MHAVGRWAGAFFATLLAAAACGRQDALQPSSGSGLNGAGSPDGGSGRATPPDGGAPDAGAPDGGAPDGGAPDAGAPDGGSDAGTAVPALKTISFPTSAGWAFYGPQHGGPQTVYDAAFDRGGNLWVAGGQEGLFLMRADASGNLSGRYEKFGIADGLHPYGWVNGQVAQALRVPDGSPADPNPSLLNTPVISVAGGPAGTVFVGYQGKPGCEWAWHGDQWTPPANWGDPSVYKSGDADRVTLTGSGIAVVHYDIFSGPGVVPNEVEGREKICSVYRIVWDQQEDAVWFGGNHGFAVAKADAGNTPTCGGEPSCDPVWEHSHPAISGCLVDYDLSSTYCPSDKVAWLTDAYYGVAIDPSTHDLWLGGTNRTTKFHSGTYGGDYFRAQADTEAAAGASCSGVSGVCGVKDRWDLWPDQEPEWDAQHGVIYVSPAMRSTPGSTTDDYALDDAVSGIAGLADGTAWLGSFAHGLIHIDSYGSILGDATANLPTRYVSAVALDPLDGGLWVGLNWGGGVSRMRGGAWMSYGTATFGDTLGAESVGNVQGFAGAGGRKIAVAFKPGGGYAGAVAVYSGN